MSKTSSSPRNRSVITLAGHGCSSQSFPRNVRIYGEQILEHSVEMEPGRKAWMSEMIVNMEDGKKYGWESNTNPKFGEKVTAVRKIIFECIENCLTWWNFREWTFSPHSHQKRKQRCSYCFPVPFISIALLPCGHYTHFGYQWNSHSTPIREKIYSAHKNLSKFTNCLSLYVFECGKFCIQIEFNSSWISVVQLNWWFSWIKA